MARHMAEGGGKVNVSWLGASGPQGSDPLSRRSRKSASPKRGDMATLRTAKRVGAVADDIEGQGRDRPRSWTRYLPLALLVAASIAAFAGGAHRLLSLETVVAYRDRLQDFVHQYGAISVLAYSAFYITAVALAVPGAVFLTILGGFLFGWLIGGVVAAVSATIGAILVFLIARTSIGDILLRKAGPRLGKLAHGFRRDAFSYLLFLRLLPVMPFWLTNLAPALFDVQVKTFALATMTGILPATFTFAIAGSGFDSVIAAQKASFKACKAAGRTDCSFDLDIWTILTPQILAALAALAIMALVPIVVRRWRGSALDDAGPTA
jgi:uncharacterized membrane protein YdjX (TVP38/TMEM64 family)